MAMNTADCEKARKKREYMLVYKPKYDEANKERIQLAAKERRKRKIRQLLVNGARARARLHGLPFDITQEDVVIPSRCPILGIEIKISEGGIGPGSPSLDKLIPELGYVRGNVFVISHRANTLKSNATLGELRAFAKGIVGYLEATNPPATEPYTEN